MIRPQRIVQTVPAIARLARLAPLGEAELTALAVAAADRRKQRPRFEMLSEGREIGEPRLLLEGWAARVRLLADGRRQFLSFLLPGDLVGLCSQADPLAVSTVIALTHVAVCPAPNADALPHLAEAYAVSRALEEGYLLSHITRLGRLNAQERIGDLLLELYERLSLADLTVRNGFELPLTQEVLADMLGLTSVHVNRTLQSMRREGDIEWKSGRLTLSDPEELAGKVGRVPVRVTGRHGPAGKPRTAEIINLSNGW